jgi:hypothetical protein
MFRRESIKAKPEEQDEGPGMWWTNPDNLALLIRSQWLHGHIEDVEDVLTILEHPEFWEGEFLRTIAVLDRAA